MLSISFVLHTEKDNRQPREGRCEGPAALISLPSLTKGGGVIQVSGLACPHTGMLSASCHSQNSLSYPSYLSL